MIFPLAYLVLTSSLTVVLIVAGLAGRAELAADLAVIQGALLATFYAFSANTRSLILQGHGDLTPERLLAKRLIVLPLVGAAAILLSAAATGISPLLAVLVVMRRACEWLAEVRLCELEVAAERKAAQRALAIQVGVTLAVALVIAFAPQWSFAALAAFAAAPLIGSTPRPKLAAFRPSTLGLTLRNAFPYIGSTTIDGVATYVLRLVVFLVAGRDMAGMLFTAFVLGSFAATLFANVLGPTLALSRSRGGRSYGVMVGAAALSMGVAGTAISAAVLHAGLPDWLSRPGYFWLALGLSLLGAAVMTGAQWVRLRLFDERRGDVLFGPDVLRAIAVIVAAPSLYYLVGPPALASLYLLTGLLTIAGYWGAAVRQEATADPALIQGVLAAALLSPVFFMLDGRIYHSAVALVDAGGGVMNVPLPASLAACFAGLLLVARYRQATLTLGTIFFLFIAMVLTTVLAAQGYISDEVRKFVLLFQFLVPAFALALGEMYGSSSEGVRNAAIGFLAVICVLVPLQLARSIGHDSLRHDLWFFSVYQHLEYVPSVLAGAFVFALLALWEHQSARRLLVVMGPVVAYYAARAHSVFAVALLLAGALVLVALRPRSGAARLCALLVLATVLAYFALPGTLSSRDDDSVRPVHGALHYWALYGNGIVESARTVLFGHPRVLDRTVAPSAYNYYLDFVYNFGLLAFLPLAWLLAHTVAGLWRGRRWLREDAAAIGLALAFVFVVALDNMFKVPLRQPYSGIAFFFLWGMLLARLPRRAE